MQGSRWFIVLGLLIAGGVAVVGVERGVERGSVRVSEEEADLALLGTPSVTPLPDGSALYLDVAEPTVPDPGTVDLSARMWLQGNATPDRSVVFVLDLSGSAAVPGQGCGGDLNADGLFDTVMDCEFAATLDAAQQMADWGTVGEVSVVFFELLGGVADVQPAAGIQRVTTPLADLNADGVLDLQTVLASAGHKTGLFGYGATQLPVHPT